LDPLAPAVRPRRFEERLHRPRRVVALAVADDPLVGLHSDDEGVLHRVRGGHVDLRLLDDDRFDVRDLHAVASAALAGTTTPLPTDRFTNRHPSLVLAWNVTEHVQG